MAERIAPPEWIYPGAEILLHESGRDAPDRLTIHRVTVEAIAAQSFLVSPVRREPVRIQLKDLRSKTVRTGGYHSYHFSAVELDSERGRELLAKQERIEIRNEARRAVLAWGEHYDLAKFDDPELIKAAIDALTRHHQVITGGRP